MEDFVCSLTINVRRIGIRVGIDVRHNWKLAPTEVQEIGPNCHPTPPCAQVVLFVLNSPTVNRISPDYFSKKIIGPVCPLPDPDRELGTSSSARH